MASRAPSSSSTALRAVVLSAPAALRAPLTVRLAGDPADAVTRVDHWAPRGTLVPQPGDLCLVAPDDEGHLWLAEWEPAAAHDPSGYDTAPIGSVMTWSGRSNPSEEYALANGQTLSRSAFPDGYAFAQQEETLGNPDWTTTSTTFTVPNYVGRFLFHRDVQEQGDKEGDKEVTLTDLQSGVNRNGVTTSSGVHEHNITAPAGHTWGVNWPGTPRTSATFRFAPDAANSDVWVRPLRAVSDGTELHVHSLTGRTADKPHNNMPPYVAVAMFVKVSGVTVSSGAIVGPSGADGVDGVPGGASGFHAADSGGFCSIPDTGPAGPFLVRGDLIVAASGGYYVAVEVEISSGGAPLWSGTLSAWDLGTNLPMSIAIPEGVMTLGAGEDLTLSAYPSIGDVTESRLTALAFHDLAVAT